jgi:hypothetical protein
LLSGGYGERLGRPLFSGSFEDYRVLTGRSLGGSPDGLGGEVQKDGP